MASFEERYELLEVWGRGAHGTVWKARARATGRIVAVKRVRRDPRERAEAWEERLRREAELLGRVRHPGIVEVVEVGFSLDEAWLVTEFVEGGSLEDLLRARGRLAPLEAASLVAQAARALDAAHRAGVVHRDVKPGNLLLAADGSVKITDFGVAGHPGERAGAGEDPGVFVGTPAYTAPEQLRGEPVDARADTWSLGVVLWRCLAGAPPFRGLSVAEIAHRVLHDPVPDPDRALPGVPAPLRSVLRDVLRKDPAERPARAVDMARALEAAVVASGEEGTPAGIPGEAAPVPGAAREQTVLPARRSRGESRGWRTAVTALAAASLVAALVLVSGGTVDSGGKHGPGIVSRPVTGSAARRALVEACERRKGQACAAALGAALAEAPGDDRVFAALGAVLRPSGERKAGNGPGNGAAGRRRVARVRAKKRKHKRTSSAPVTRPRVSHRPGPRPAALERPSARREEEEGETRRDPRGDAGLAGPVEPPGTVPSPGAHEAVPGRGVVELLHPLSEGLVELLVDGRRAGLVRVGPGTAFPPGRPVTMAFSVSPGEHRLLLRVLSATARIELEREWTDSWPPDGFRARRWEVAGRPGRWTLVPAP